MDYVTVILAGGRSRRMGRDKAALRLQGEPLTAWQARRLGGGPSGGAWLSVGHHGVLPPCAGMYARWVCDETVDGGPLQAMWAVLRAMVADRAKPQAAGAAPGMVAFVPVDMPLLERTDLDRLARRLAMSPGAAGVMGCWPDGSLAALPSMWRVREGLAVVGRAIARGQRAVYPLGVLPAVVTEPLQWERDRAFGVNVNTEEEWQTLSRERL